LLGEWLAPTINSDTPCTQSGLTVGSFLSCCSWFQATVGYYFLGPGQINLPRILLVAYFLGGLVALATYRLRYEHNLKIGWEAGHPPKAPS